jgi:AraC family transcriptional activator of pobA
MNKEAIPIYHNCMMQDNAPVECLIMDFDRYLEQHRHMVFPHMHDFYHFVYFEQGGGSFTIDFEEFAIANGQLYFMAPGQVHEWRFTSPPKGYVINFESAFLKDVMPIWNSVLPFNLFNRLQQQVLRLSPEENSWIRTHLQYLSPLTTPFHSRYKEVLASGLLHLLHGAELAINKHSSYLGKTNLPLIIQQYIQLIEQHYREKKLPKQYAEILPVSANQLNSLCQEYLQRSAGQLIRDRIILEAKRLLIDRTYQVAEIAYTLQFQDPSYFTKFFKKQTQMTPEAFRVRLIR